jgi:hypothetical protein
VDLKLKTALLLLVLGCGSVFSQITLLKNNPQFGDIPEGELVTRFFFISNSSSSPVRIDNVRPRCGCTVLQFVSNTIQPGKKTRIDYSFKSAGYNGHVSKSIIVIAGETQSDFAFSLNVIPNITFQDSGSISTSMDFGLVPVTSNTQKLLTILVRKPAADTRISDIVCNTNRIRCLIENRVPVNGKMTVRIQPIASSISNAFHETLTVNLIHSGAMKIMNVFVSGTVVR